MIFFLLRLGVCQSIQHPTGGTLPKVGRHGHHRTVTMAIKAAMGAAACLQLA